MLATIWELLLVLGERAVAAARVQARAEPHLGRGPVVSSKNGRPEVKSSPRFRPGMPASCAGVVPKSLGSTSTPYLKKPKRTSRIGRGVERVVGPQRHAVVAHLRTARPGSRAPAAAPPNAWGPLMSNLA